jgi:hypothetical protein
MSHTNLLSPSYTLMKEAEGFFQTSVHIYQTARCHVPQDNSFLTYCDENLKTIILNGVSVHINKIILVYGPVHWF